MSACLSTTWPGSYWAQGRYAVAEPLYKRTVSDLREGAGTRPSLGRHSAQHEPGRCRAQGRYRRGRAALKRGLAVRERRWDPTTPTSACRLNNLAMLYQAQGRYAEAEPLYEARTCDPREGAGPDHPDLSIRLNNLARCCTRLRAVTPRPSRSTSAASRSPRRRWGPTTLTSASALNNLAVLYRGQGRYAEAEPLYKRSLAISEKALGPDHPDVGVRSTTWRCCTRLRAATPRPSRSTSAALAIAEKALGPDHPRRRHRRSTTWPSCTRHQGRYAEAEPLYKRALADQREGADARPPRRRHLDSNNLAGLYQAPGPLRRGRAALQAHGLRSARRHWGPTIPMSAPRSTTWLRSQSRQPTGCIAAEHWRRSTRHPPDDAAERGLGDASARSIEG